MFKKTAFIFSILFIVRLTVFSQSKWDLKRDDNGIEIYTRTPLNGDLKELRVVCEFTATKAQLIKTLQDIQHYKNWVYSTKKNVLIKTVNPRQLIYYAVSHLPWPIRDRDLIVELSIIPDSVSNQFRIQAKSIPDYLPQNPDLVRVPYSQALWKVIVVNDHTLKVDYTFSVNPGGSIPAWLVNTTLSIGPYKSFMALRELLKNEDPK